MMMKDDIDDNRLSDICYMMKIIINVDLLYDMIMLMIDDDDSVDGNWCL